MVQAAHDFDAEPKRFSGLSPDEQRIANAVVAALQSELKPIRDTQEQHTKILTRIEQEMRGVNKVLAGARLILDDPDN